MTLREEEALREHGIAAMSCLLSGLQVFDTHYDKNTRLLRLIKGVHGFHVYATEYWTEYLLTAAAIGDGLKGAPKMLELATQLADALDKMRVPFIKALKVSPSRLDERLNLLEEHKVIQSQVEKAILARSRKRLESEILQNSR